MDLQNINTKPISQGTWTSHHSSSQQSKTNPAWFMSLRPAPSHRLPEQLNRRDDSHHRRNNSPTTPPNQTPTVAQKIQPKRPPSPPPKPESTQAKFRQLQQEEFHHHRRSRSSSVSSQERESSRSPSANTQSRIRQIQELPTTNTEGASLEHNRHGDRFLRMPQTEQESMWGQPSPGRAAVFRTLLKQFAEATLRRRVSPDRERTPIPSQTTQQSNQQPERPFTRQGACEHGESRVRSPTKSRRSDQRMPDQSRSDQRMPDQSRSDWRQPEQRQSEQRRSDPRLSDKRQSDPRYFDQNRMQLLCERSRSSTHLAMASPTEQELVPYVENPAYWNPTKTTMLHRTSNAHFESVDPMSVQQWDRQYIDGSRGTLGGWGTRSPRKQRRRLSGDPGRGHGTNSYLRGKSEQQVLWAWGPSRRPASAAYGTFTPNCSSRNCTATVKHLRRC